MSVLDIGCNAGFYSLEMKRRGADHVIGIDTDERYLKQARFAAEVCGSEGVIPAHGCMGRRGVAGAV